VTDNRGIAGRRQRDRAGIRHNGEVSSTSGRVTIAEIAKSAGVSIPTVSKVINSKPGVSDATRLRVSALLREFDYEPRRSSPHLMLELVLGEFTSPWSSALVPAVEQAAFDEGYGISVSRIRRGTGDRWLEMLSSRSSDGVIFAAVHIEEVQRERLAGLGLPIVVIDPSEGPRARTATIGVTHWRGAYSATEHLIQLGHRELAMIAGPAGILFSQARVDGFRAAAATAGITIDPARVVNADFNYEEGRDAALGLLASADPPTAIFAASDEQAFGVYEAARQRGIPIPQELSVIGFNDVPIAQWAAPPLTTVREPLDEMARQAVATVLALGAGQPEGPAMELSTELIVRDSCAAPSR
jgi:DNA-binding LacI/PurR family transcriptional regulator